jgi:hypothetical protein
VRESTTGETNRASEASKTSNANKTSSAKPSDGGDSEDEVILMRQQTLSAGENSGSDSDQPAPKKRRTTAQQLDFQNQEIVDDIMKDIDLSE